MNPIPAVDAKISHYKVPANRKNMLFTGNRISGVPVCLAGSSTGQRSPSELLLATLCRKPHTEALPYSIAQTNQRQRDRAAGCPGCWRAGCSGVTIPTVWLQTSWRISGLAEMGEATGAGSAPATGSQPQDGAHLCIQGRGPAHGPVLLSLQSVPVAGKRSRMG